MSEFTIVVGVDGSEGSLRALAWAVEDARARGATVRAVMAWSYLDQSDEKFDPAYGEDDAQRRLAEIVATVPTEGVNVETQAICDLPEPALLDAAANADLVVVGFRGHGGFKGALLGSVSQQIIQRAKVPVVLVPGTER